MRRAIIARDQCLRQEESLARLQRKDLAKPDEVRDFDGGSRVEIFQLEDVVVGRTVWLPGWRWSEVVKPIAGTDQCEYHHLGYSISGRFRVAMPDGTEMEIPPNHVYEIPPGHDAWVVGDEPWVAIDWAGMRSFARPMAGRGERIVATLVFTDIVDSTAIAERLGDDAWRELLAQHNERVRWELDRFRGREVTTTGDGFLATFDGAERAVLCAQAICVAAKEIGLVVRAGVHTGEVEVVPGNLRGLAVHIAARVVGLAGPAEVVVSWTTRDLLAGTAFKFEDRGMHELKGIAGPRAVYAVTSPPEPKYAPPA
jgi:class 3 adenylate cyclase